MDQDDRPATHPTLSDSSSEKDPHLSDDGEYFPHAFFQKIGKDGSLHDLLEAFISNWKSVSCLLETFSDPLSCLDGGITFEQTHGVSDGWTRVAKISQKYEKFTEKRKQGNTKYIGFIIIIPLSNTFE